MKELLYKIQQLESGKIIKESVSPDDLMALVDQYANGKLDYAQFKSELKELEERDVEQEIYGDDEPEDLYVPGEEGDDWEDPRDKKESIMHEDDLEECGGGEITTIPITQPSKQQDNVNMNINMSGSGAGGIRDLLKVLRDLDGKDSNGGTSVELPFSMKSGSDGEMHGELQGGFKDKHQEEYANSPSEKYSDVSAVTASGNDLHKSHDSYSHRPYRGDNPMEVKERLESLYSYVKSK